MARTLRRTRAISVLVLLLALVGSPMIALSQQPENGEKKGRPDPVVPERLPAPDPLRLPVVPQPIPPSLPGIPVPSEEVKKAASEFVFGRVDPQLTYDLIVGRPSLLVLKDVPKRVQIGDETIVSTLQITEKELSLTGQQIGSTVLNFWFQDPNDAQKLKILSYLVRVFPDPQVLESQLQDAKTRREKEVQAYQALEEKINQQFPDSVVRLTLLGDKLLVVGQSKDIEEATHIMRIVGVEPTRTSQEIFADQLIVNVSAEVPQQATPLLIEAPTGRQLTVINMLRIPGEQQVLLRVTVAEVNRAAARSIGVNFSIMNNAGVAVFSQLTGNVAGAATGMGATLNNLPTILDNGQIIAAINALRTLNFARSIAEPTLVALQGQTASFQAGGQFPVPVVTGFTSAGLQGVSFVPFGVSMNFTPIITDRDRIRLQVSAEVSTRDTASSTNINGANINSLNTRNFDSVVELREGQTLAVAGLIQNNFGADATRVPLLGDLPVAGRLFSFDRTSAGEQELIVLITPELVRPVAPGKCMPLPGDDLFEPSDVEFYLLGRLENRRPMNYRSPAMTDFHRRRRYHRCEQLFISGPTGYCPNKQQP